MKHRIPSLVAASIAIALAATPSPSDATYRAEPYYVLGKLASYQTGCFPPCLCPVLREVPVRGIFRLTPTGSDGAFDTYDVTQVNWSADVGGPGLPISGSGTYRIGGEAELTQQLDLDLVIDGDDPQHFDSGLVAADGAERPSIDVAVSRNGMFCHDTVIVVDAAPVVRDAMLRYQLVEPSSLQEGCVDPCACLLEMHRPISGSFSLLPLERSQWYDQFAVLDIRWSAYAQGAPMRTGFPVTGAGLYQVGGDFALEERLALDLIIDAQGVKRLEGSRAAGSIDFPNAINVPISTDTACFETAIDVHAKQMPAVVPLRERR